MKLSQIRLITNDFHKSVAFYRDVMEFSLGTYAEEMQFASFNTGETKIEIFSRQQISEVLGEKNLPNDVESQSQFLLCFAVDQIDEVCAGLKKKGVLFINEPQDRKDWNARVAQFRDPDGNVIELYKHPL
jgi:lactoylglutathione lyase